MADSKTVKLWTADVYTKNPSNGQLKTYLNLVRYCCTVVPTKTDSDVYFVYSC